MGGGMRVSRRRWSVAMVVAVGMAVLPIFGIDPAMATNPGENGRIVAQRGLSLVTMNPDGSDVRPLISTPYAAATPAWSPGGTMVAFTRQEPDGDVRTYIVNGDGTGLRRLTAATDDEVDPAWSPDGSTIAISSYASGNGDIYLVPLSGGPMRQLTSSIGQDLQPTWSPDGRQIAFVSDRHGRFELFVMNADGSGLRRLSNNTAHVREDFQPSWSPVAPWIAFSRTSIHRISPAGGTPVALTDANTTYLSPSYSPDGRFIVYEAMGSTQLWVMSEDGTGHTMITSAGGFSAPDWQPIPAFPLVDARFSPFSADIEWVYDAGITRGCDVERYCPEAGVTREQMASFLVRALGLPEASGDYFTDDASSIHQANINRLAEAGITGGCAPGRFCPKGFVTREQMASFLVRALRLAASSVDRFTDDETSSHEADINSLAASGITGGCGADRFCPRATVTRGQMAAFLHRGLDR